MLNEVYEDTNSKMQKTIDSFKKDLSKIRTGRANPSVLEDLKINYYNTPTPLKQLAGIAVPEPRLIVIQPWDKSALGEIEKAIMTADLGFNPNNDGNIIRIPIPPLTEETRKEIVKKVKKMAEEAKIAIRNIRQESNDLIKELEKGKDISEDEKHSGFTHVQKIHDDYIVKVNDIAEKKEKEIMEI
ncbi:MAG: ribosome recycling factor [bacterium]|nr:ribosome recycling factor [bacterium]